MPIKIKVKKERFSMLKEFFRNVIVLLKAIVTFIKVKIL